MMKSTKSRPLLLNIFNLRVTGYINIKNSLKYNIPDTFNSRKREKKERKIDNITPLLI